MNIETRLKTWGNEAPASDPTMVKLTVGDFHLLKQAGVFAGFSKAELLWGELSGVPLQDEDEPESDASVPIKLRVQDYLLLDEAGAFKSYAKTELIDGVVYAVSPQHRPHGFAKDELSYRLRRSLEALESPLHVATEQSVEIAAYSDLQPDIILTTEPRGPGAIPVESVALIVEIAATTLTFDLSEKARVYAAGGIPEYWVTDVNGRVIHQMWAPEGDAYSKRRQIAFGEAMEAASITKLKVRTDGLG